MELVPLGLFSRPPPPPTPGDPGMKAPQDPTPKGLGFWPQGRPLLPESSDPRVVSGAERKGNMGTFSLSLCPFPNLILSSSMVLGSVTIDLSGSLSICFCLPVCLYPPHPSILSPQVLVGVVKDEGSYFLVYGAPGFSKDNESLISRAQFLAGVRVGVPQASDLAAEAVVLHYTDWLHPEDPARLREAMSDVVGDHNVVCPVAQLAGRLAAQGARVYAYIFEHRASTLSWPLWMGVPHGYEIEFIFGLPLEPSLNYTAEERTFAQRLMRYWANFARTGSAVLRGGGPPGTREARAGDRERKTNRDRQKGPEREGKVHKRKETKTETE